MRSAHLELRHLEADFCSETSGMCFSPAVRVVHPVNGIICSSMLADGFLGSWRQAVLIISKDGLSRQTRSAFLSSSLISKSLTTLYSFVTRRNGRESSHQQLRFVSLISSSDKSRSGVSCDAMASKIASAFLRLSPDMGRRKPKLETLLRY